MALRAAAASLAALVVQVFLWSETMVVRVLRATLAPVEVAVRVLLVVTVLLPRAGLVARVPVVHSTTLRRLALAVEAVAHSQGIHPVLVEPVAVAQVPRQELEQPVEQIRAVAVVVAAGLAELVLASVALVAQES